MKNLLAESAVPKEFPLAVFEYLNIFSNEHLSGVLAPVHQFILFVQLE